MIRRRRSACEGRRLGLSQLRSVRSTNSSAGTSQLANSTIVYSQVFRCQQPPVRPYVPYLLLPRAPDLLDVMKMLFNSPAFGTCLENGLHVHIDVGAEVGGPVAACVL